MQQSHADPSGIFQLLGSKPYFASWLEDSLCLSRDEGYQPFDETEMRTDSTHVSKPDPSKPNGSWT